MKRRICILFAGFALFCGASCGVAAPGLQELQQRARALADGGTFSLPESCQISGTLVFRKKSGITIDGQGKTLTQLRRNTIILEIVDCADVTIRDLVLVGDPSSYEPFKATDGIGISMQRCTGRHQLDNVEFRDHGCAGFKAINVSNIIFRKCRFSADEVDVSTGDAWNCGIWSYGTECRNWEIEQCAFDKTAMGLMFYLGHDALNIHDNQFTDIRGQHGMYLNASSYVNIRGNTLRNIRGVAIKLQMNNGHNETEKQIYICDNVCTVEDPNDPGQAGITVGAAKPDGPAKGVYWENVIIQGNRVKGYDYGVGLNYVRDVNVFDNELLDTTYGILGMPCSGTIRANSIVNTKWSGIYCQVLDDQNVVLVDNTIRGAARIGKGDIYRRCCIYLTGSGSVALESNRVFRDGGRHLYGLYQGPDVILSRFSDNTLPGPVELTGRVVSQSRNNVN